MGSDASFLIVTEEGTAKCVCYPYRTEAEALVDFCSWRWHCSRLLFAAVDGEIARPGANDTYPTEIKRAGFSHPFNTIRRCALALCSLTGGEEDDDELPGS